MRILSTNPAIVPRHRLNETDFATTRTETLQMLRRTSYDIILITDLPETPAARVLDWVRTAGWRIPVIVVGEHLSEGLDALACLSLKDATTETLEAYFRQIPRSGEASGDWPPGNVQELIILTKESVTAQTHMASEVSSMRREITELRTGLREDIRELGGKVDEFRLYADKQRDAIVSKISEGPWSRIQEGLKWLVDHPILALAVFCALLALLASVVVGINALEPGKIEMLKDLSGHGTQKVGH